MKEKPETLWGIGLIDTVFGAIQLNQFNVIIVE